MKLRKVKEFPRPREEREHFGFFPTSLSKTTTPSVTLGANHPPCSLLVVRLLEQRIAQHPYFLR